MKNILRKPLVWALLLVIGCAAFGSVDMCVHLRDVFQNKMEDMSFGWLVPVFSLYVLWTEKEEIKRNIGQPSWLGLVACIPFALMALLGTRGLQVRLEQVGFIGLCICVPWAFLGRQAARCFVFPALYLGFTIPLASFLDMVTIHLRLLASGSALAILNGIGVEAVQKGTAIFAQGEHPFSIDVADPCSGLRSLFSLMALTAAYSWFIQPTWRRRFALFACAVPLAVAGNVTRIVSICLVAAWGDPKFATGFYHDYSGYVVFIVAISLMLGCSELITRFCEWRNGHPDRRRTFEGEAMPLEEVRLGGGVVPWLAVALLGPIFIFQGLTAEPELMPTPAVKPPVTLAGYESDGVLFCTNEQCAHTMGESTLKPGEPRRCPKCGSELDTVALGERTVLPEDTIIYKRIYQAPTGRAFFLSMVIGGRSKSSLHRPELCLPAQGFLMRDPRNFEVEGRPFHAIRLERPGQDQMTLVYTFFNQNGMRTNSHTRRNLADTWSRSVFNRIDRWVMVTVGCTSPGDARGVDLARAPDREAVLDFLGKLSKELP